MEARERPLYLELLKIARQMVAEASGRPDTRLPFQAGGIDRRGAAHKAPRSLSPTVAVGGRGDVGLVGAGEGGTHGQRVCEGGAGVGRRGAELKWSGAELELFFALLD